MLNVVWLLAAAALVSMQFGVEAHALGPKLNLNSPQPNVVTTPKRRLRKHVRILQPPPEVVDHVMGDQLVLNCSVIGHPVPSVVWQRNGKVIADYEESFNEILSPDRSGLAQLISKLVVTVPSNGDVYTCVATAGEMHSSASTTVYTVGVVTTPKRRLRKHVRILQPPPEVVDHVMGDQLVLNCSVIGHPVPSVVWQRNGKVIADYEESFNEILSPDRSGLAQLISKLVVTVPSNGDVYTCVATAGEMHSSASTTVYTVGEEDMDLLTLEKIFRQSKPVITATYDFVLHESDSNLVLPCRVRSLTKTLVNWVDNHSQPVYDNDRFRVLSSGDLLILGLKWGDMGSYKCMAENAYGVDTAVSFIYPFKPE